MREYKDEVNEQYRAYGEFIVKFEQLVFNMQHVITFILYFQGLRNQSVTQILISGQTAYPLQEILHSLISETQELDAPKEKLVNKIFKEVRSLIEIRNDLVHSVSFIGYKAIGEDYNDFGTFKYSRKKSGASPKNNTHSVEKLDQLILKCQKIDKDMSSFLAIVTSSRLEFDDVFKKNKKGEYMSHTEISMPEK